jgi:hypothetical protein
VFILGSGDYCFGQTTTVFDILVATETLTVVGTTTVQGAAFSVGASSFVVRQGNVGVATAAPAGIFTVANGTFTVLKSGFIGVGTSTPTALFQIVGATTSGIPSIQFEWIASSLVYYRGHGTRQRSSGELPDWLLLDGKAKLYRR